MCIKHCSVFIPGNYPGSYLIARTSTSTGTYFVYALATILY